MVDSTAIMDRINDLNLDVVVLIRSFYLLVAAGIIIIYSVPALKSRFLAYGARATPTDKKKDAPKDESTIDQLLDLVASITVPHAWFSHFYTFSIGACLLWLGQIAAQQPILHFVLRYTSEPENPVPPVQVIIGWVALLVLSFRRYLECADQEPSNSQMFVGHWIMGMLFYGVTSVAIWIEGDRRLIAHTIGFSDVASDKPAATGKAILKELLDLLMPSVQDLPNQKRVLILLGLALFYYASKVQSNVHGYLKYMKQLTKGEYTLPNHPLFDYTFTPHYFAECVEYVGLALIMGPPGRVFSTTMLCALVFVAVNLGVTADGTREWYRKKFGEEAVEGKARMIPLLW